VHCSTERKRSVIFRVLFVGGATVAAVCDKKSLNNKFDPRDTSWPDLFNFVRIDVMRYDVTTEPNGVIVVADMAAAGRYRGSSPGSHLISGWRPVAYRRWRRSERGYRRRCRARNGPEATKQLAYDKKGHVFGARIHAAARGQGDRLFETV
jgi:hypothetical protein